MRRVHDALPSCVRRGRELPWPGRPVWGVGLGGGGRGRREAGGAAAYGAGVGRGGKVRGGRRQAVWTAAVALNLTDGEG